MHKPIRGALIASLTLTTALSLAGCVKVDTSSGGGSAGTESGDWCRLAAAPPTVSAGATSSAAATAAPIDASRLRVGLAYDIGGRGDASFNDAAAAGLDRAVAELGLPKDQTAERTSAAGESEDAKTTRLRQLATEGFNPVIAVGFAYADALAQVAPQFPATKFAIVDSVVEGVPNVTPLVFAEEQGSFLVGVAAAYKSMSCHVGFVGGVNTPLIQKFQAGFEQGARAAAPGIVIETKYLTAAGDMSGFQDPAKGNVVAKGELDAGADVVFHAAGASGKGVFEAVNEAGKFAIGVDSDQFDQTNLGEARQVIITSMLKRVDVAVFDFVGAVVAGGLGALPQTFDLAVDGVGYSTSGGKIDDIVPVLEGYKAQIVSGKIEVASKP